jgi:hypothetical protein
MVQPQGIAQRKCALALINKKGSLNRAEMVSQTSAILKDPY